MRYNQNGSEDMFLEGPYDEFLLMGQGLTGLKVDLERRLDEDPGFEPAWTAEAIDGTLGKLPHVEVDAAELEGYRPDRYTNIGYAGLAMTCSGLRIVRRAARLARVSFGAFDHEVTRRLNDQIKAYGDLHDELNVALRTWR